MRKIERALSALALGAVASWASANDARLDATPASSNVQYDNQRLADELARRFRADARLSGFSVDIEVDGGVVLLTGSVAEASQKTELLNIAHRTPGVVSVVDKTKSETAPTVLMANYAPQAPAPLKAAADGPAPAGPVGGAASGPANGLVADPAPLRDFPGGISPYSDAPVVPPYSWPSYTPYNNFASLAYQTQYPSGAWPFIGPPYPYPMIPSGWRRVTLKWQKGYWWLKFHSM